MIAFKSPRLHRVPKDREEPVDPLTEAPRGYTDMTTPFTASDLKTLPTEQVQKALSSLSKVQIESLQKDYKFWARPKQIAPDGKWWSVWFLNCGRGFGKTWTGVQWVREQVKQGHKRIAAVAATNSDIEKVMIGGDSGFLNLCCPHDKKKDGTPIGLPHWSPTKRTLFWYEHDNSGNQVKDRKGNPKVVAQVEFFSAEEPERLRGPQFSCAWADELAAWRRDEATWDMLNFCLRLGKHPRICVTTTPKSTKLVRKLVKGSEDQYDSNGVLVVKKYVHITNGTSYENDNLPETFFESLRQNYEGTRLGRQEIYAEILAGNEGALWTADMIDECQVERDDVPELIRKVVALDPAMSANVESDMTGIVVAGIDINGHSYVLGDYTFKGLPETWAAKAIDLYHKFECDRVVYETNQGRDLIPSVIRTIDDTIPLKGVHASTAKIARAEPVSALYERGKVKHVRNTIDPEANLSELETQMTTFEPMGKYKSPDRYDALVWAITELALKGYSAPKLRLSYTSGEGLR